jgi:hypothetical protein
MKLLYYSPASSHFISISPTILLRTLFYKFFHIYSIMGWRSVKALRYYSEGPGINPRSLEIFSGASDSAMCPGVDSVSKNKYQDILGGKDGRCVRVTTLPPSCAECLEILKS